MRVREPSSRVLARLLRGCGAPIATSAAPGDVLRQPSSSVPDPPEVCKESSGRELCRVFSMTLCLRRVQTPRGITLPPLIYAADSHGEAHGSAMFELRERDKLPQPCQGTTEDGHQFFACEIAERQLKGNNYKIRRTHASREKRAA